MNLMANVAVTMYKATEANDPTRRSRNTTIAVAQESGDDSTDGL